MQLVNEFVVPRGIDETWAVLTDVELIAPAMPGAKLGEIVDGKYHGTVKIKVGPVTAAYGGVATFRELDEATHHVVLEANGKESSGRGRASAVVTADLVAEGTDTRVKVTTDLTISGPLAQFGRGAIAEVSAKLLTQFVDQLKATVLASAPAAAGVHAPDLAVSPAATPAVSPTATADAAPVADRPAPAAAAAADTDPAGTPPAPLVVDAVTVAPIEPVTPAAAAAATPAAPVAAPEVDLLRVAAWPILKRLIPTLIVVAVIVVLLVWWLG